MTQIKIATQYKPSLRGDAFPPTKHPKGTNTKQTGMGEEFPYTPVSTVLEPIVTFSFAALPSGKNHQQKDPSMMHPPVFDLCTWVKVFFTKKANQPPTTELNHLFNTVSKVATVSHRCQGAISLAPV